ncbi:glycerophosphodiester phosphodiesterase family protein [Bowdeniella nasicola]|uniref:glycerophosphodiester phosphodiesterase family protein n=1 Tax=Bowdeniella nasicola TaxID=208480 RepID=UPI000AD868CF|nr:glycerophosphodiester phosphodiesterase family protein [Bowdeniella nasicola]
MSHPYLSQPPIIFAHRGGGREAPENSWTALSHTRDLGLRYLETDAHITADGQIILSHDPTVDRTLTGSGLISQLTWSEISRMRDTAGDPPVRLIDALDAFPELHFNIDAKSNAVAGPLARLARYYTDRMCLASFSDRRLALIRDVNPHVAVSIGQEATARLVSLSVLPERAAVARARRIPAIAAAIAAQVPAAFRGIPVTTRKFVDLCHALNMQVHVWTVDDAPQMRRLLNLGVDGIVTDRPAHALEVIGPDGAGTTR